MIVVLVRRAIGENDILHFTKIEVMVSFGTRVSATVAVFFGWLAFIVLYLAFFAGGFDFWQKLAIFIASGAIIIGAVALLWIRHVLD